MTRSRKALGCGATLLLFCALFLALPTRKIIFRKHYDVVSIATLPEYKDHALLDRAHAQPAVSTYPTPPVFQTNGSLCGPTSLANVFRSLGDEKATADSVLAGSGKCSTGMCFMGLSLDELADLARRHSGVRVTVLRDLSLADFRKHLAQTNDPNKRYTINFDRGPLFGLEGGHHSPIGGYLAEEDLVLVIDVNEKYAPWLVKTERLFTAMDTMDSGKKRGLLLIEKT
jgi:hypothetical protein